ncbi:unnamed protein product [Caretta caretta]
MPPENEWKDNEVEGAVSVGLTGGKPLPGRSPGPPGACALTICARAQGSCEAAAEDVEPGVRQLRAPGPRAAGEEAAEALLRLPRDQEGAGCLHH